jgi:A/G-specific adenine glycosylase
MRAEALIEIAERHDQLPSEVDALLKLPRVGPYVANATLCFGDNQRKAIVDRNVRRVYPRVFGERFPHSNRDQREFAKTMLPEGNSKARKYNFALLDFGALICKKQEPLCEECFAREYCSYYQSDTDED